MNYYDALQLKSGGWHYTCMNDGRIWPVGYCAEHEPHATKEEAYECYKKYLLDHRLKLDVETPQMMQRCVVCGEWTRKVAQVDHLHTFILCDQHRTREKVSELYGDQGQVISSW